MERDTMKTINVRELRNEIPRLRELLAEEHELLLVSNGEPVARILPTPPRRPVPSLAEHRAGMPMVKVPSEVLIREERDRR
jgi:antitoxin (DNA-binding transcriptional repressor) of toxin-antitoxin stability system